MSTVAKSVAYGSATKRRLGRVVAVVLGLATFSVTAAGWAANAHADPIPVAHPVASPMEDQAAMAAFSTQFGTATAVGGFGGTVVGAGVGCGHTRDQHTRVLGICRAPAAFASLVGASPIGGRVCPCVRYRSTTSGPLARIFRKH